MKHKLFIPILFTAFIVAGGASFAYASDDKGMDDRSGRPSFDNRIDERKDEMRSRFEDKRDDMRNKFEDSGPVMRGIMAARVGFAHEWMVKRLTNIADRIETRADELANDGKNVADVRMHVTEAREDIAIASTSLTEARDTMKSMVEDMRKAWDTRHDDEKNDDKGGLREEFKPLSDDAKADLAAARAALESARDHLKEAVTALKAAE